MKRDHRYRLLIEWTGNTGKGTGSYGSYKRDYKIKADGKADIPGSSDPVFHGDPAKHNPEELFVASIAACHMLWYLHFCAVAAITVTSYMDNAVGVMQEEENGSGHFTEVTLHPIVVITDKAKITEARALHQKANQFCFIANSCNFPINHEPEVKAGLQE